MYQMMVLQCSHSNLLWRLLTLQGSGCHFARSFQLNQELPSFTSLRRLTTSRTRCNLLSWRSVEQWRYVCKASYLWFHRKNSFDSQIYLMYLYSPPCFSNISILEEPLHDWLPFNSARETMKSIKYELMLW